MREFPSYTLRLYTAPPIKCRHFVLETAFFRNSPELDSADYQICTAAEYELQVNNATE